MMSLFGVRVYKWNLKKAQEGRFDHSNWSHQRNLSNVSRVLGRDWSAPLMLVLDQHWPGRWLVAVCSNFMPIFQHVQLNANFPPVFSTLVLCVFPVFLYLQPTEASCTRELHPLLSSSLPAESPPSTWVDGLPCWKTIVCAHNFKGPFSHWRAHHATPDPNFLAARLGLQHWSSKRYSAPFNSCRESPFTLYSSFRTIWNQGLPFSCHRVLWAAQYRTVSTSPSPAVAWRLATTFDQQWHEKLGRIIYSKRCTFFCPA